MMPFVFLCYPTYKRVARAITELPFKARSLLIKQCQAQYDISYPLPTPTPTLVKLLDAHPPVVVSDIHGTAQHKVLNLRDFFSYFELSVADPVQSPILLDLLRGMTVTKQDANVLKHDGWIKEISLAESCSRVAQINFRPFFQSIPDFVHPDIPYDIITLIRIRNCFRRLRDNIIRSKKLWYPRGTHKNMSWSTRRSFEEHFGEGSLDGVPIFGQDDWQRIYNLYGIKLDGDVELRQKWYPSQAKPRTYAAMGGTAYDKCRFLQDFFTDLTDCLPPTHRIHRLRPGRLFIPPWGGDPCYRIYDLASFTSNMIEQKNFCEALAEFMDGVTVTIVDEVEGPVERDLGEMLREYNDACIFGPSVSLERTPTYMDRHHKTVEHATASLLGIFGNLMTCTVAHYLLLSSVTDSFDENNTAGDDGLVLEYPFTSVFIDLCMSFVGSWEESKCFKSTEEGAICLKRPLVQIGLELEQGINIVPPTLSNAASYLQGKSVDDRFEFYSLDMTVEDRVSVVGTDLMRFLRSCWRYQYPDLDMIYNVWKGFERLASSSIGRGVAHSVQMGTLRSIWPSDPKSYDFYRIDPLLMFTMYWSNRSTSLRLREEREFDVFRLREENQTVVGNSTRRLVLLERLGYIEREDVMMEVDPIELPGIQYLRMTRSDLPPLVYRYTCVRDIPECFMYYD